MEIKLYSDKFFDVYVFQGVMKYVKCQLKYYSVYLPEKWYISTIILPILKILFISVNGEVIKKLTLEW